MLHIPFNNRYLELGDAFYKRTRPTKVAGPGLIAFNRQLATELGIQHDDASDPELAAVFAGNDLAEGAEPLAMAYSGHQFGQFNPQLGDGRAILLGEVDSEGVSWGIQLKGSGQTHFSRNGDGRAALGPVLREYLVSEAMAKLGVPTTRALAAVTTGEDVARERLLPGGVITRVARSFVRVGTFEYFMAREDVNAIRSLADHVIQHNYPECREAENPYAALLASVVERQAALLAKWMQLGFIHGVMNTDNMSVSGDTIDYGPCAFMDSFNPDQVYSYIDRQGRYAYSNQPPIALWNLTRLAETLLPLVAEDPDAAVQQAQAILQGFIQRYEHHWLTGMLAKCGLQPTADRQADKALVNELLDSMAQAGADFTLSFYHLSRLSSQDPAQEQALLDLFDEQHGMAEWLRHWRDRLLLQGQDEADRMAAMQAVNPVYIPRNHQVEAAIRAAEDHGDFSVFHALHAVLQAPFTEQDGKQAYMQPPRPDEVVRQTFCGT